MQKNKLSVLGVSEVRWTGQGEIRSGDFTVFYSGGERGERCVAIEVHKNVVRSVVKKTVMTEYYVKGRTGKYSDYASVHANFGL